MALIRQKPERKCHSEPAFALSVSLSIFSAVSASFLNLKPEYSFKLRRAYVVIAKSSKAFQILNFDLLVFLSKPLLVMARHRKNLRHTNIAQLLKIFAHDLFRCRVFQSSGLAGHRVFFPLLP